MWIGFCINFGPTFPQFINARFFNLYETYDHKQNPILEYTGKIKNDFKHLAFGMLDKLFEIDNNGTDIDFEFYLDVSKFHFNIYLSFNNNYVNITNSFENPYYPLLFSVNFRFIVGTLLLAHFLDVFQAIWRLVYA